MKSLAIKLVLCAVITTALGGIYYTATENQRMTNAVYRILESDTITTEDAEFVKIATDPDVMKEGFVSLDDQHRALFKKQFGYER